MKERIFKILGKENPKMLRKLKQDVLKLRISTIHSFCLSLLERFAPFIDLEPEIKVLEDPSILWFDVVDDTLRNIAETEPESRDYKMIMDLIAQERFRGWSVLRRLLEVLFERRAAAQRANVGLPERKELIPLITELYDDPVGPARIPDYSELFPERITSRLIQKVREKLDSNANLFLTQTKKPRRQGFNAEERAWAERMAQYRKLIISYASTIRALRIFHLFKRRFLAKYQERERQNSQADFTDLELLTHQLIFQNPEWSNILYSFDEHTDHILVDEFQDTNFLQWSIIDKLSEEWRSGYGAKQTRAIQPTIFLVGDDKQSIYYFRGANAQVFTDARAKLEAWYEKDKFEYEEVKDNYRSLQAIIDFTNFLFSKLMNPAPDEPAWHTRYAPFERKRKNDDPGSVELILAKVPEARMPERRQKEADLIAKRICTMVGKLMVYDGKENPQPCQYQDMTILLRKRTYLDVLENALQKHNIPFVVVKGIGFHGTPEVSFLRAFVSFLADPSSDFSLYVLLRNPVFSFSEKELLMITRASGLTLWQRLKNYSESFGKRKNEVAQFQNWLDAAKHKPISHIIEEMLKIKSGWKIFSEPSRLVNVKKFIRLVEDFETQGRHPMRIQEYLQKSIEKENEPKANIRIEGKDAVRIMTIHAAKGLQFPIVFVPGLEESLDIKAGSDQSILIEEISEDKVVLAYQPEADLRKETQLFIDKDKKEIEEAKRLFYVAVTRARDHLFLTGIWKDKDPNLTRLRWLKDAFGLSQENGKFKIDPSLFRHCDPALSERAGQAIPRNFSIADEEFINKEYETTKQEIIPTQTLYTSYLALPSPLPYEPSFEWQFVTRELEEVRRKSEENWTIFGEVMHQLFEEISNSRFSPSPFSSPTRGGRTGGGGNWSTILTRATHLLLAVGMTKDDLSIWLERLKNQFQLLATKGLLSIILPQPNSYAELLFMLKKDKTIYSGRIDRVIKTPEEIKVYDYKTFPLKDDELRPFIAKYAQQLAIYKEAVSSIFEAKNISTYLLFTALG
ncbi:MAG: UvrD-helicase domain-containing protein, partial [candidate division WOR-3 bacterium]|nr:UvrD-helicase domain-containing protein [candidate division WOR-3 bacterium]